MKVNIGPYRYDIIPIRRWEKNYEHFRSDEFYHREENWNWFDRLVYKAFDGLAYISRPLNRWSNNRPRKVEIVVDGYDTWNADHTMALVIHAVLEKYRANVSGIPSVDIEDVPSELHSEGFETEELRWEWVLDEMIWAFEQLSKEDKGDEQFFHNSDQLDISFKDIGNGYSELEVNEQKNPEKPKYWVDTEGKKLHYERISNGLKLFAKYYLSLWN